MDTTADSPDLPAPVPDVLTVADIAALWRSELTFARSLVRKPGFPATLPYRRGRWLRDEVLEFRKNGPRHKAGEPDLADMTLSRAPRGRLTRTGADSARGRASA